jgi:hypothetical protein
MPETPSQPPESERPNPRATPPQEKPSASPQPGGFANQASSVLQSATRFLEALWIELQPTLRQQSIRALRGTSQTLNQVANSLETTQTAQSPASIKTKAAVKSPEFERVKATLLSANETLQPVLTTIQAKLQPLWGQIQARWPSVIAWIRGRLPENLRGRLSDRALTGAIAGLALTVVWLVTSLPSGTPPTQVATAPSPMPKSTNAPPVRKLPVVRTPVPEPSLTPQGSSSPTPTSSPSPEVVVAPSPLPTPTIDKAPLPPAAPLGTPVTQRSPSPQATPVPSPTASQSPAPAAVKSPAPAPTPKVKLTPQQVLVAKVQEQVTAAAADYGKDLVAAVQPDFQGSTLSVSLSDAWYALPTARQDQFAGDVFNQAQNLSFKRLELKDSKNSLLARDPVLGNKMVILKRRSVSA